MKNLLVGLALLVVLSMSGCSQRLPTMSGVAARITATLAPTFTPSATPTPTPTATLYPTYTPYPTFTPLPTATVTPIPTATPIAVVPRASADWPTTIRQAADSLGGNADELQGLLSRLGAMGSAGGAVRAVDLTHDGKNDLLVWYLDPNNPNSSNGSNVLVLTDTDGLWRIIFDATLGAGGTEGARLLEARDLNNDRQVELAYALSSCGANGCSTNVRVGVWSGTAFRDLTTSEIRLPSLREASFVDQDGDGRFEMVLTGGGQESANAGPQRERTEIYSWTPSGYALTQSLNAATDSLPLVVWEANDALERGDPVAAITQYERAINDDTLRAWAHGTTDPVSVEAEKALLRAFSRFRLVVIHASLGNRAAAYNWLDSLRTASGGSPFRQAAEQFAQRWRDTNSAAQACQTVTTHATQNTEAIVAPLNNFGLTGPQFSPQDICPLR